MEDALDLMVDMEEVAEMIALEQQQIEFFYHPGLMSCPIDGCNPDLKFYSKGKWQRHWEEKHTLSSVKYLCSVKGCGTTCKRRADMRAHIKLRHERDVDRAEQVLNKCEKKIMENRGYINPGFFTYRGRTQRASSAATEEVPPTMDIPAPVVQKTSQDAVQDKEEVPEDAMQEAMQETTQEVTQEVSQEATQNVIQQGGSSSLVQNAHVDQRIVCARISKKEMTTQTTCLDYATTTLVIPPPPDNATELQLHIMWLCNLMDQTGRARELAKRKLDKMTEDSRVSLEQERKRRRELEAENQELKRQLTEMDWRSTLFSGLEE
ncbi:hypothetical protein FSP39_010892 [Pinctada imbricata]|uniref:C2H2-type domain-containing protein n=1 Tax=Pinctada imbricata TaxID=66713 RepID=A0AA88YKW1_PINIB|nr:hypothetical protein FSP39_010892 [Pinctada imbricata]